MDLQNIDFTHQLQVLQIQAQEHWKTLSAMAGVAYLVGVIWGRRGVLTYGMICLAASQTIGSSFTAVTAINFKRFVYLGALFGNGYFGWFNPRIVNLMVAGCMAISEVQFLRTYVHLKTEVDAVKETNAGLRETIGDLDKAIQELNSTLQGYIDAKKGPGTPKRNAAASLPKVEPTSFDILADLQESLKAIQDQKVALELMDQVRKGREELRGLHLKCQKQSAELEALISELSGLNSQLQTALSRVSGLEEWKTRHIQTLTRVISNLQTLQT